MTHSCRQREIGLIGASFGRRWIGVEVPDPGERFCWSFLGED